MVRLLPQLLTGDVGLVCSCSRHRRGVCSGECWTATCLVIALATGHSAADISQQLICQSCVRYVHLPNQAQRIMPSNTCPWLQLWDRAVHTLTMRLCVAQIPDEDEDGGLPELGRQRERALEARQQAHQQMEGERCAVLFSCD